MVTVDIEQKYSFYQSRTRFFFKEKKECLCLEVPLFNLRLIANNDI